MFPPVRMLDWASEVDRCRLDADWMQLQQMQDFGSGQKGRRRKGKDHNRDIVGYFVYHIVTAHSLMALCEVKGR